MRTRLKAAADAMKEDDTSLIAEDEVGPCTPPRVLPSYHVSGALGDFLRVYVVVQAQTTPFCFEEELSELTELILPRGKITAKAVAIKRMIDKVFAESKSDIVLLKNKTSGQVNDEKAAALSQLSDVANGGPPWRYAVGLLWVFPSTRHRPSTCPR